VTDYTPAPDLRFAVEPILVRDHEAAALLGLGRTAFLALVKSGQLPKPVDLGIRVSRWSVQELREAVAR
jgi:predicted DNA-binding transcriptional regulator AlpA